MVQDTSLELFPDALASRKPTPSGGSAAAVMGAMGAALVSMVCNLTIGRTQYRAVEEELKFVLTKAEVLRRDLTKMIEEDVQAFEAVMRAYGMPRLTKGKTATRAEVIQTALKTATLVPMRCCRECHEVIILGRVVAEKGNRNVVSDAGVAAAAGYAALRRLCLECLHQCKTNNGPNFRRRAAGGIRPASVAGYHCNGNILSGGEREDWLMVSGRMG